MVDYAPPPPVSQDERTMAVPTHALQVPGSWIAPLVIFFAKRESLFVRFHALQALLLQGLKIVVLFGTMTIFFVAMLSSLALQPTAKGGPPPLIIMFFPVIWLGFFVLFIFELVLAIVFAIKAGNGKWDGYPVLGNLARRFLGMDQPKDPVQTS